MKRKALWVKLGIKRALSIPCWQFRMDGDTFYRIDFVPWDTMPGFTHRVALDGVLTKKYLSADFAPSETAALDMLDMLLAERVEKEGLCSDCPKGGPGVSCEPCPYQRTT